MRAIATLSACLLIAACTASPEEDAASAPAQDSGGDASPATARADLILAESAWLVVGMDGSVYTTMIDPDGSYRDFSNGAFLQSGTWQKREDGELCFVPEDEGRAGDCWSLGNLDDSGRLRATSDSGREVELRRVAYSGPGDETDESED